MRSFPLISSLLGAALMSAGAISAHAAVGTYYDPSNAASPTGFTIGHELFRTIGCPGKQLLDSPCAVPKGDSDGDGVTDDKDKCPTTPAGRKVNAEGCELDSDGDGIMDGADTCPDVHAKTKNGCPVAVSAPVVEAAPANLTTLTQPPAPTPKPLVLEGVNFDYNQATLTDAGRAIIDQNAEVLAQWADARIVITGHTDSRGSDQYNMGLSLRRAEAVRDYLISKGIPVKRLITRGLGEARPIADNKTDEGRSKNRRVELSPLTK